MSLLNVADYEREAERLLDPGPFGYYAGGAGDEVTLRDNVTAFSRWQLRPRVLVDVAEVTASWPPRTLRQRPERSCASRRCRA